MLLSSFNFHYLVRSAIRINFASTQSGKSCLAPTIPTTMLRTTMLIVRTNSSDRAITKKFLWQREIVGKVAPGARVLRESELARPFRFLSKSLAQLSGRLTLSKRIQRGKGLDSAENSFSFVSEFVGRVFRVCFVSRLRKHLIYLLCSSNSPESSRNEGRNSFISFRELYEGMRRRKRNT